MEYRRSRRHDELVCRPTLMLAKGLFAQELLLDQFADMAGNGNGRRTTVERDVERCRLRGIVEVDAHRCHDERLSRKLDDGLESFHRCRGFLGENER